MAEPIEGILVWQGEGKNRKRLLRWRNKVGEMAMPNRFSDDQLTAELRNSQEDAIDVHLELENGQPRRIRPVGAGWSAPAPPVQTAPVRNLQQSQDRQQRNDAYPRQANYQTRQVEMRPGDFHNPYNFVPAPPRVTTGELRDCEPAGHDHYHADKFSGKLSVTMTVETPLLLLDTADVSINGDHKTYPVRKDENGLPCINPTAVKGMLRSAYEAITNSRLSVFHDHDERLAFRMESTEGAMSVPARVENGAIVLYTGTSDISAEGRPLNERQGERNALLCAAWLPFTLRLSDGSNRNPRHGEKLFAWLEKIQHINRRTNNPDFQYWRVRKLVTNQTDLRNEPQPSRDTNSHKSLNEFISVEGYVCNTGENIKNKHDERFFFIEGRNEAEIIKVNFDETRHGAAWERLIKNYRQEHSEKNGDLTEPPKAERYGNTESLEWSRHIVRTLFEETSKDAKLKLESIASSPLCYARVKQEGNTLKVEELYPVIISRRLHSETPLSLLEKTFLHPAYKLPELSPADRVFGWVRQAETEKDKALSSDEKKMSAAYRGQLRVGAVRCLTEKDNAIEAFATPLPLQILGQPKPQQGRFYVAEDGKGGAQREGLSNEDAGYKAGKGLRGRKVYPHHQNLPEKYWVNRQDWQNEGSQDLSQAHLNNTHYREYLRPKGEKRKDSQNRSIEGWVKQGAKFTFDLHFINLSKIELGGLIWLLQLGENHFHRFGGGKPLGFGSVQLTLNEETSEILSGAEIKMRYESLNGEVIGTTTIKDCRTAFENAINDAKPGANFLEAFEKAAQGFAKPVHYPRLTPNPNSEGKNFEWFVNNNSKDGFKVTLPNLTNETGLPLMPKN
jgi:CRISPR-associated protein (TIGR03986 family)